MDYLKLIKDDLKIDFNKTIIESWDIDNSGCPFEIKPKDFLRFAKQDFKENTKKGNINSLTNSKRAIDCEIDTALSTCGIDFDNISVSSEALIKMSNIDKNLSYKLQLISSLNFAPSGLISKVRTLRNEMEHYYQNPSKDDVKDALELSELFIRSVDSKINDLTDGFIICDQNNYSYDSKQHRNIYNNAIFFKYDFKNKLIAITLIKNKKWEKQPYKIDQNVFEYYFVMNILNNMFDEFDLLSSLVLFLRYINHPIPEKHIKIDKI
ncbi:MAG: hypothetical protein JXB00_09525 [Bacteroidales bacterium]|nr:hypothetical protein [Bacteroidales bacterium]